jgi:hypothetical protein
LEIEWANLRPFVLVHMHLHLKGLQPISSTPVDFDRQAQTLKIAQQVAQQTELSPHNLSGKLSPRENDFAVLRPILLALLPQVGGILLTVVRDQETD